MKPTPTTELTQQVAARLRARRSFLDLTQEDVVKLDGIGFGQSTLSRIEDGDRAIEIEYLFPLCVALGLDPITELAESWAEVNGGGESTGGLRVAR